MMRFSILWKRGSSLPFWKGSGSIFVLHFLISWKHYSEVWRQVLLLCFADWIMWTHLIHGSNVQLLRYLLLQFGFEVVLRYYLVLDSGKYYLLFQEFLLYLLCPRWLISAQSVKRIYRCFHSVSSPWLHCSCVLVLCCCMQYYYAHISHGSNNILLPTQVVVLLVVLYRVPSGEDKDVGHVHHCHHFHPVADCSEASASWFAFVASVLTIVVALWYQLLHSHSESAVLLVPAGLQVAKQ